MNYVGGYGHTFSPKYIITGRIFTTNETGDFAPKLLNVSIFDK